MAALSPSSQRRIPSVRSLARQQRYSCPTLCPRLASAPRIRVYPQEGLSSPICRTRSTIVFMTRGRPGPRRWLYLDVTSSRYHRNSVSGVTLGFKLVQHLAPECLRFSGESTAFGIGETKAPTTQALLEH